VQCKESGCRSLLVAQGTFTRSGPEAATLAATRAALSAVDPQSASDFQQPSVQPVELLVHQVGRNALVVSHGEWPDGLQSFC